MSSKNLNTSVNCILFFNELLECTRRSFGAFLRNNIKRISLYHIFSRNMRISISILALASLASILAFGASTTEIFLRIHQGLNQAYLVEGSARWDGFLLNAYAMPDVREGIGAAPCLRGRIATFPDGTVKRLEYAVYLSGHEDNAIAEYAIDYIFDGKWGLTFPRNGVQQRLANAMPNLAAGPRRIAFRGLQCPGSPEDSLLKQTL